MWTQFGCPLFLWVPFGCPVFAVSKFCSLFAHLRTAPYSTPVCAWTPILSSRTIIAICIFLTSICSHLKSPLKIHFIYQELILLLKRSFVFPKWILKSSQSLPTTTGMACLLACGPAPLSLQHGFYALFSSYLYVFDFTAGLGRDYIPPYWPEKSFLMESGLCNYINILLSSAAWESTA